MPDDIDIEEQYNKIAVRFDTSRRRIWNNVKKFLLNSDINIKEKLLDAGCGNGKNSLYAMSNNYEVTGIDISNNLLEICLKKGINVYYKNIIELEINDQYDKCICIAVIHHINSIELQCDAIVRMINSLKYKGELLISIWSYEKCNILSINDNEDNMLKNENDYRDFEIGHNYIDWKLEGISNEIVKRYYYIHDYNSFKNLIEMVKNIINIEYIITWEKQNWFCKISKII